jgi:endonuclease III
MTSLWWVSVGAAGLIAGLHAGIRLVTDRLAFRADDQQTTLKYVLGGVGVRMALVLVLMALTILYVPVDTTVFVIALTGLLIVSFVFETAHTAQRLNERSSEE